MIKYDKVNTELVNYVRNKEELSPIEIKGNYYTKLFISDDILFIMELNLDLISLKSNLALCLNTRKEVVLQVFSYGLNLIDKFVEDIQELNYSELSKDFEVAIKDEFLAVIENLEFDNILLKDADVIERAKNAGYKKLEYNIPVPSFYNIDIFTFAEILNDIHDAAYSYLEKYLKNNLAYLRECQRICAVNKLIDEKRKSIGLIKEVGIENAKEVISNIFNSSDYKSVRITLETKKDEEYTVSVKVKPEMMNSLPPIYAIKEIKWKKNILYKRIDDKKTISIFKTSLSENLEFLERMYNYKKEFILPIDSFFDDSLYKNPLFMLNYFQYFSNKDEFLPLIGEELLKDLDFAVKLVNNIRTYDTVNLLNIYELFSDFQNEEEFCLAFLNKREGIKLYKHFTLKMKQNKNILKSFIKETTEYLNESYREIYDNLTCEVLNTNDLVHFIEGLLLPYFPATYNLNVVNKDTTKDFLYRVCIFENKIPVEFTNGKISTLDDDFMKDFLSKTESLPHFLLTEFTTKFKHLLKENEVQKDLIAKITTGDIKEVENLLKICPDLLSFENIEFVLKEQSYKTGLLLPYCEADVQIQCLKAYPNYFRYIFKLSYASWVKKDALTDKVFKVLDNLLLSSDCKYYLEALNTMCFEDDTLQELIKRYPNSIEYLNGSRVKKYVKDFETEVFMLPYIKSNNWNISQLLADKDFIRNQAKLNPLVLKYLNTPRKNSYLNSLHNDKDFVLELIKKEPKNIYGLWKKSPFWHDINFAKQVVELNPEAKVIFPKKIQKELD